jgi:hypothetical protein
MGKAKGDFAAQAEQANLDQALLLATTVKLGVSPRTRKVQRRFSTASSWRPPTKSKRQNPFPFTPTGNLFQPPHYRLEKQRSYGTFSRASIAIPALSGDRALVSSLSSEVRLPKSDALRITLVIYGNITATARVKT